MQKPPWKLADLMVQLTEKLGQQLMTKHVLPWCNKLHQVQHNCNKLHLPGTFTRGGLWMVLCPSFLPDACWVQLLGRLRVLPAWQAHTACHGLQTYSRNRGQHYLSSWQVGLSTHVYIYTCIYIYVYIYILFSVYIVFYYIFIFCWSFDKVGQAKGHSPGGF